MTERQTTNLLRATWIIVLLVCFSFGLGRHSLIDPDEGRNGTVALTMAQTNDFLVPTLNGVPYLDKPPLYFATAAASIKLFGPSELAVRLPSFVFFWATVVLTAWFGLRRIGRDSGWVAGVACATAPLSIAYSRIAIFDSMLTFFIVGALIALFYAVETGAAGELRQSRWWSCAGWLSIAAGVLTKGPVALALPLLVTIPFAIWRRRLHAIYQPAGLALFVSIIGPWLWAVERAVPGFLHYALITETWGRFTTDELNRDGPAWYFLPYLVAGAFPWSFVALTGLARWWRGLRSRRPNPDAVFLILWLVLPFIFFTLSQSKRPHYILPLIPAIALVAAKAWRCPHVRIKGLRTSAAAWTLLGVVLLVVSLGAQAGRFGLEWEAATAFQSTALTLSLLTLGAGIASFLNVYRIGDGLIVLSLPLLLLPFAATPALDVVARERSGERMATAIRPHLTPATSIVGIESFSPSLTFYLGRSMTVATATGKPLTSNYVLHSFQRYVDDGPFVVAHEEWWRRLVGCPTPTIYLLKPQFVSERETLDRAGLPVVFENRKLLAQGPCAAPEIGQTS